MAKLFSYYGLCPLIDQKSLLGLSEDKVQGCVIVTLGKKIVIRYKLSDQKQLSSWSTKDMLTTSVVYDEQQERYTAAFSNTQLRVWLEHENNLDKVKKHKFQKHIHTFITQDEGPVVIVFKDGTCSTIEHALETRKVYRKPVLSENTQIRDQIILSSHGQTFMCYITENEEKELSCVLVELDKDNFTEIEGTIKTRSITRPEQHLKILGYVIIPNDELSQVMTVWSDGRLFMMNLFSNVPEKGIGTFIAVLSSLSRNSSITLLPLSPNYVAMYGADTNEEGASLIIYNIQFKIMQSRQQFKLFSRDAKLFTIGNSILLAAGQGIAVVPFQLATEQLASIVGSQKVVQIDDDIKIVSEMEVVEWGKDSSVTVTKQSKDLVIPNDVPFAISKIIRESVAEGLPETLIVDLVFPILIETKSIEGLMWCLNYFKDIPESLVASLLNFVLTLSDGSFEKTDKTNGVVEHCMQPLARRKLVNRILQTPISEATLMPYLRKSISFTQTVELLKYLYFLFNNPENQLSFFNNDCDVYSLIVQWSSLLIDSHYQEFILSRDSALIELLVNFRQIVSGEIADVTKLKRTTILMDRLKEGKSIEKNQACIESRYYSIETIQLC